MKEKTVPKNWIHRAVLLSFWMFSAWYLYIGGILTKSLTFSESLVVIVIANIIFAFIFMFYAGTSKPKDILFAETFGKAGARYFISPLPTLSQIGWYAIVVEIGGTAVAYLLGLDKTQPLFYGIFLVYGLFTIWVARGGLSRIGKLSYASIPAMLGFTIWGAYTIVDRLGVHGLLSYQPTNSKVSLAMGIQILLASFISAAVTIPDFLCDLERKKDIFLASFWGLVPTALLVGGLGAAFAIIGKSYDVLATLQIISGPMLVYALLGVDNLCGAQAVFPVGIGFANIFSSNNRSPENIELLRKFWTFVGGLISIALAMVGVVSHLEIWLTLLGTVFAPIIGVVLSNQYVIKQNYSAQTFCWSGFVAWSFGCSISFIPCGIPILNALVFAFVAFSVLQIARR